MRCKHCGFETQEPFDRCPACGKLESDPVEPEAAPVHEKQIPQEQPALPRYNRMSVVGFILSCSSFVIAILGLNALVGLICSIVGLSELRFVKERGKGFAVAGIVISIIALILNVLAVCFLLQLAYTGKLEQFLASMPF